MEYKLAIENERLNKAYKEALTRSKEENEFLPDDVVTLLKKSQESWTTYKDSHCDFVGLSRGAAGSWSGWHIDNCKLQMTLDRMKYLNAVFWG